MLSNAYYYLYLHGFASSPTSAKANFIKSQLNQYQIDLDIPDLNQGDFTSSTLSKSIALVKELIKSQKKPVVLFGSSFGALQCAIMAEHLPNVKKMVLLAPAFNIKKELHNIIPSDVTTTWQEKGNIEIYHHGAQKEVSLNYSFLTDLHSHNDSSFTKQIPTLILHGINDQTIPIQNSYEYLRQNPKAKLVALDDSHGLENSWGRMWNKIAEFCISD